MGPLPSDTRNGDTNTYYLKHVYLKVSSKIPFRGKTQSLFSKTPPLTFENINSMMEVVFYIGWGGDKLFPFLYFLTCCSGSTLYDGIDMNIQLIVFVRIK